MMRIIYKYPFKVADWCLVDMPADAEILSVQVQGSTPCIWALVTPDSPVRRRIFRVFGTGHPLPAGISLSRHVATFQDGSFIWHLFDAEQPGA